MIIQNSQELHEVGIIIIPNSRRRKPRLREAKELAPDGTEGKQGKEEQDTGLLATEV